MTAPESLDGYVYAILGSIITFNLDQNLVIFHLSAFPAIYILNKRSVQH